MSETQPGFAAEAAFPTTVPARYMSQLCKHFQHRRPVVLEELRGSIEFPSGLCELAADAQAGLLRMRVTAKEADALPGLQDVVARHLLRFAFREPAEIVWHQAG